MNKGGVYILRTPGQASISTNVPGSQRVLVSPSRTPLSTNPAQVVSPISYSQPTGRSTIGSIIPIKSSTSRTLTSASSLTTSRVYISPKKSQAPRNVITKSTDLSLFNISNIIFRSSVASKPSIIPLKPSYTAAEKLSLTPPLKLSSIQNIPIRVQPSSSVIVTTPKTSGLQTPRLVSSKPNIPTGISGYSPSITFSRESPTSSIKTSLSQSPVRTTTAPSIVRISSPSRVFIQSPVRTTTAPSMVRINSPSRVSIQKPSTSPRKSRLSDY